MQDIHAILGGGGDRRLRPHHHQNHQVLKCPRCDSTNTKFCYYNNYNLTQPRHFCKTCRRYWTNGGVLRNVPVGGGCRKSKRSSKPKASSSSVTPRDRKSNSHSSNESTNLMASITAGAATAAVTPEVVSASSSDSAFNFPQATNPSLDPPLMDQSSDGVIFPDIGNFTSFMTESNNPPALGFGVAGISPYRSNLQQETDGSVILNRSSDWLWQREQKMTGSVADGLKMPGVTVGSFMDQTAPIDLQGGGDQNLFDLTGTVDQDYWSQIKWTDSSNRSLNLP